MTCEEFPLLDTLPVGVCVVDGSYHIRYWNRPLEHWTGLSREETCGAVLTELFPLLAEKRYRVRFDQVLETGLPAVFSSQLHKALLPCRRLGGQLRDQQTTVSRVNLEAGNGLVFAVEDVTELSDIIRKSRTVHKKLETQSDYLKIFASAAAHDLQAPLRHISGFSDILSENLKGNLSEESKLCLDMISKSVNSLQTMITDLLSHAKVGTATELAVVDLNGVLDSALFNLGLTRHSQCVEVKELPKVHGNRGALVQLFQNLIANALKYTGDAPPRILVSAVEHETETLLRVKDNGPGIRCKDLQRIFLPFQRLVTHEQIPGTGLGLSTCRQVVEIHGGRIWAESVVGEGSEFWVSLPR